MPFTLTNIKRDLQDIGPAFDGAPDLEFRAATKALALEQSALSYQRVPPGYRFPYGHTHETQEEVYVVVRGSGRMKVDDEIVELNEWDAVRVPPGTWRGYEAGPEGLEILVVGAGTISARILAKTSTAGATGGLNSRRRRCDARSLKQGAPLRDRRSAYAAAGRAELTCAGRERASEPQPRGAPRSSVLPDRLDRGS